MFNNLCTLLISTGTLEKALQLSTQLFTLAPSSSLKSFSITPQLVHPEVAYNHTLLLLKCGEIRKACHAWFKFRRLPFDGTAQFYQEFLGQQNNEK